MATIDHEYIDDFFENLLCAGFCVKMKMKLWFLLLGYQQRRP